MSGMFDSKNDKAKRKIEKTQKEEKARRKSRRTAIIIVVVLVVVSAVAITLNSNFIRRTLPVVTIDGVGFSAAEFEYFVHSEHSSLRAQFQGAEAMLPDPTIPLSAQMSALNPELTWAEHLTELTIITLTDIVALYNAALAYGFELPEEQYEAIDNEIEMWAMQAASFGFPSTTSILQQSFGQAMNERTLRNILEFILTAEAFDSHMRESIEYSDAVLTEFYEENKDNLDVFNFRQASIWVDVASEEEFATEEEYIEAAEAAREEARLAAEAIIADVESEDEFIMAAGEHDPIFFEPMTTVRQTHGEWLPNDFRDWLLDESRSYGDTIVFEGNEGLSYTALFFTSRDANDHRVVGMRQILLSRESVDPGEFPAGEFDPGFIAAMDEVERELRLRAELVETLFRTAGGTAEAMNELIEEGYSDDFTDGFYSNIALSTFHGVGFNTFEVVPEIQEWLFYENREYGQSALIHTEAFGYHLIYFTGFGDVLANLIAADRMRTPDHREWIENLERDENPQIHGAFFFVSL